MTKDIIPITLRVSDRSTQFGEIPENGRIWSLSQKVKTYGQRLAQQVSIGFSIDLAEGVKPVIYQKSAKFSRKIKIQEVKKAIEETQKDTFDLPLWSDRSKAESIKRNSE